MKRLPFPSIAASKARLLFLLLIMAASDVSAQDRWPQADSVYHQMVRFSPDGSLMAWSQRETGKASDDIWSIWLAPVDGSDRIRVAKGDPFFSFHPDGSRIVYARQVNGTSELFHIRIDGKDEQPITSDGWDNSHPFVTPNGRTVHFVTRANGSADIARIDISGGERTVLTQSPEDDLLPSLSPDGRLLTFYRSIDDGRDQIFLMEPDGANLRALTDGTDHNFFPVWTPDDYVSWISESNKGERRIRTSPTTLFRPLDQPADGAYWQVFSPDGRQVATIRGQWPVTWIEVSDAGGRDARRVIN
jgi:Tol biopolymer transport system component